MHKPTYFCCLCVHFTGFHPIMINFPKGKMTNWSMFPKSITSSCYTVQQASHLNFKVLFRNEVLTLISWIRYAVCKFNFTHCRVGGLEELRTPALQGSSNAVMGHDYSRLFIAYPTIDVMTYMEENVFVKLWVNLASLTGTIYVYKLQENPFLKSSIKGYPLHLKWESLQWYMHPSGCYMDMLDKIVLNKFQMNKFIVIKKINWRNPQSQWTYELEC